MTSKKSQRKRSRPVKKHSPFEKKEVRIGIIVIIIAIITVAAVYIFGGSNDDSNGNEVTGNTVAIIETSMGTIKVELYQDLVSITVENFIKLANDGFYEGMIFHRVKDDFMIQTGSLYQDESYATSPYGTIPLEIDPNLIHEDGSMAMARATDPDSASCGFYICDGAQPNLDDVTRQQFGDRGYAVFGKTIEGLDVVHSIASVELDPDTIGQDGTGRPMNDVIINSITIEYLQEE